MTDADHDDRDPLILDPADDAMVADAISPEPLELTLKRVAAPSRVSRNPRPQKFENPLLNVPRQIL